MATLCAVCVMAFGSSTASSAELYSYVGPNYSPMDCTGTYVAQCSSYHLTGSFTTTLSLSQLTNLTSYTIPTADISSFSFSDGSGFSLSQANSTVSKLGVTTNGTGDIVWWVVQFQGSGSALIATSSCLPTTCPGGGTGAIDFSETSLANEGGTIFEPFGQSWAAPQLVMSPEASGGSLMGFGLLVFAAFYATRQVALRRLN